MIPAKKPDIAAGLAAHAPGAAEAPHRMYDVEAGRMVDCKRVARSALEAGAT